MSIPAEILELWREHSSAAFPRGYGRAVKGIDLALLDAEIAGSIRMYVHNGAKIDAARVNSLREHLTELNTIVLLLDREEMIYFDRLRRLATLVLLEVEKSIEQT